MLLSDLTQMPPYSIGNTFSIDPHRSSAPSILEQCVGFNNGSPEHTPLLPFFNRSLHLPDAVTFPLGSLHSQAQAQAQD
jgi:hypothetical protein